MIVGNDEEFGFMAGGIDKGLNKARDLASAGNRLVIYKMGEEGAITLYNNEEIKTGFFLRRPLNRLGLVIALWPVYYLLWRRDMTLKIL